MIEARDSRDPHTGSPSNYGVAQFNLAARSIVSSTGDILASGADAAANDWVKVWVDLRSRDGKAAGQQVTFGGFEISPRK
jgi:hypothetical protein